MMYAIIHNDTIEAIVFNTNGLDLTDRNVVTFSSEQEMWACSGFALIMTNDGIVRAPAPAWADLRIERNRRLAECDWTQLSDAPVNGTDWLDYRSALRNLPDNTTDPFNPIWPTPPV